jgi:ribosomal protein S18 acetylase RimI-like enzyme
MPQQADPGEGCGTLMSIAVLPETQGKGIGRKLVDAFLVEADRRGLKQVNLLTDKQDNNATNRFYQRYGFHVHRSYITPEGREINEYRIDLPVNGT